MSHCDQAREWILAEMDDAPFDPAALKSHLAECSACADYAAEMRTILSSLKGLEEVATPTDLTDRVMARIERENTAKVVPLRARIFSRKSMTVAAAVVLMALAVPFALQSQQSVTERPTVVAQAPQQDTDEQAGQTSPRKALPVESGPTASAPQELASSASAEPVSTGYSVEPVAVLKQPVAQNTAKPSPPVAEPPVQVSTPEEEPVLVATSLVNDALSGEEEGDVYYDPLSEWVGF